MKMTRSLSRTPRHRRPRGRRSVRRRWAPQVRRSRPSPARHWSPANRRPRACSADVPLQGVEDRQEPGRSSADPEKTLRRERHPTGARSRQHAAHDTARLDDEPEHSRGPEAQAGQGDDELGERRRVQVRAEDAIGPGPRVADAHGVLSSQPFGGRGRRRSRCRWLTVMASRPPGESETQPLLPRRNIGDKRTEVAPQDSQPGCSRTQQVSNRKADRMTYPH
jgi:hypothetical protein